MVRSSGHKLVISKKGLFGQLTQGGIEECRGFTGIFGSRRSALFSRAGPLVTIPFVTRERYCSEAVPRVLHTTSHSVPRAKPHSEPDLESVCNR